MNKNLSDWVEFSSCFSIFKEKILPNLYNKAFYPKASNIFRAFEECGHDDLKVIILGQDPYHDNSATGLAFDNKVGSKISPSLRNILLELKDDVQIELLEKSNSYLQDWPSQGILLLNTALTVEPSKPLSHTELWKPFTEQLIIDLNKKDNLIWIMWGKHAQSYKHLITNKTHIFIESAHPSPFSANKGFLGSKPFSMCNAYLNTLSKSKINW